MGLESKGLDIQVGLSGAEATQAGFGGLQASVDALTQAVKLNSTSAEQNTLSMGKGESATKKWWEGLLGFNLAWEAGAKVMEIAKEAFSWVTEGGKAMGEFVAQGGEFHEQFMQFDSVAKSFGQDGNEIITTIQEISGNTIGMSDVMKLGSKAVAAGLSGPDMQLALTYAKKWSESTGQEFTGVAETMVSSLAKGRYGALKEMGLVLERGATLDDALGQMQDNIGRFTDTGFNASDAFKSISNSVSEFKKRAGDAINDVPLLGTALESLSQAAFSAVKSFDYTKITYFGEVGLQAVKFLYNGIIDNYGNLKKYWDGFWISSTSTAKGFFKSVLDTGFTVTEGLAKFWNLPLNALNSFSGYFATFMGGIDKIVMGLANSSASVINRSVQGMAESMNGVLTFINRKINEYPKLAKFLGLDENGGMLSDARDALQGYLSGVSESFKKIQDENDLTQKLFERNLDENTKRCGHLYDGALVDLDKMENMHKGINASIDQINFKPMADSAKQAFQGPREEFKKLSEEEKTVLKREEEDAVNAFKKIEDARLRAFGLEEEQNKVQFQRMQEDITEAFNKGKDMAGKNLNEHAINELIQAEDMSDAVAEAFKKGITTGKGQIVFSVADAEKQRILGAEEYDKSRLAQTEKAFKREQDDTAKIFENEQKEKRRLLEGELKDKELAEKRRLEDENKARERGEQIMRSHTDALNNFLKGKMKIQPETGNRAIDELIAEVIKGSGIVAQSEGAQALAA